jgi:hypothetical protein
MCNRPRVGPGTVGWIYVADGRYGYLTGLIVFNEYPVETLHDNAAVHYCGGHLWRLPREWWIGGARVRLAPDWSGRGPFSRQARIQNGEELRDGDHRVLRELLHPVAREWIDGKVAGLRSSHIR